MNEIAYDILSKNQDTSDNIIHSTNKKFISKNLNINKDKICDSNDDLMIDCQNSINKDISLTHLKLENIDFTNNQNHSSENIDIMSGKYKINVPLNFDFSQNKKPDELLDYQIKYNYFNCLKKNIILLNFKEFFYGLEDSLQIFKIFYIISASDRIITNLRNCILLNGLILISSNIFYIYYLEPFFNTLMESFFIFGYLFFIGKYFYFLFWLIPIFLGCNVVTSFWIDEIYYDSLEVVEKTKLINVEGIDFITAVSNQVERLLIVLSFVVVVSLLNILSSYFSAFYLLKFFAMSIFNSIYVFEYILMQKYLKNYKSILFFMENKIFYFFGFGILFTCLINFINSSTINTALFLILFPLFLIASVKINNKRFSEQKEIKISNLKFFYIIEFIYLNLLNIIIKILNIKKNKIG